MTLAVVPAVACINGLTVTFLVQWFHRVYPGSTPRTLLAFPTTRQSASKKQTFLSLTSNSSKLVDIKHKQATKLHCQMREQAAVVMIGGKSDKKH